MIADFDFSPIFARYEALRTTCDKLFANVNTSCPGMVTCHKGCSDCCQALFDLSLVEAMYINRAFNAAFPPGPERSAVVTRASEIDRQLTRLKRELYRAEKNGTSAEEVMAQAAHMKIPCPLLDTTTEEHTCILYNDRPITCRLYGIPTDIAGHGHVCGFSGFSKGTSYPSVHLDKIQASLESMSHEIGELVGSRFTELDQVYVPMSMALLTKYDEKYLGVGPAPKED